MDAEAVPRAAGISGVVDWAELATLAGGDTRQALSRLRLLYGGRYTFGFDPGRGEFWSVWDGRIVTLLTAPTPQALGGLVDSARAVAS
jgi:hypothetical protein